MPAYGSDIRLIFVLRIPNPIKNPVHQLIGGWVDWLRGVSWLWLEYMFQWGWFCERGFVLETLISFELFCLTRPLFVWKWFLVCVDVEKLAAYAWLLSMQSATQLFHQHDTVTSHFFPRGSLSEFAPLLNQQWVALHSKHQQFFSWPCRHHTPWLYTPWLDTPSIPPASFGCVSTPFSVSWPRAASSFGVCSWNIF